MASARARRIRRHRRNERKAQRNAASEQHEISTLPGGKLASAPKEIAKMIGAARKKP